MNYLNLIKIVIDYIAILIMVWGIILATIKFITVELKRKNITSQVIERENIRVYLGSYILLGLEMFIVADIIAIIINPTYEELLTLVIIVLVRTIISIFLQKEMKEATNEIERLKNKIKGGV